MRRDAVKISLVMVFLLAAVDAHQDLYSEYGELFLRSSSILAVAVMGTFPAALAVRVSTRQEQGTILSRLYWSATYCLIFISIGVWLFGVIQGESPASGASHMHLVFWPVLIGLVGILLYFCCRIFGVVFRRRTYEGKT
jgi:hypothetical protein